MLPLNAIPALSPLVQAIEAALAPAVVQVITLPCPPHIVDREAVKVGIVGGPSQVLAPELNIVPAGQEQVAPFHNKGARHTHAEPFQAWVAGQVPQTAAITPVPVCGQTVVPVSVAFRLYQV